jgi:hypothetical protein
VVIVGCNSGIDFEVEVEKGGSDIFITSSDNIEYVVGAKEWRIAVCQFSDAVWQFYASSAPKEPGDDAAAFQLFMTEWQRRRSLA